MDIITWDSLVESYDHCRIIECVFHERVLENSPLYIYTLMQFIIANDEDDRFSVILTPMDAQRSSQPRTARQLKSLLLQHFMETSMSYVAGFQNVKVTRSYGTSRTKARAQVTNS